MELLERIIIVLIAFSSPYHASRRPCTSLTSDEYLYRQTACGAIDRDADVAERAGSVVRASGLPLEVKLAQHGMVQFVPAHFKVHLGTIDGVGTIIIKSHHNFLAPPRFHHEPGSHHHGGLAGDFFPFGLNLRLIEKYDTEMRQLVLLPQRSGTDPAAGDGTEQQRSGEASEHPTSDRFLHPIVSLTRTTPMLPIKHGALNTPPQDRDRRSFVGSLPGTL
jgi:hypothetical protein